MRLKFSITIDLREVRGGCRPWSARSLAKLPRANLDSQYRVRCRCPPDNNTPLLDAVSYSRVPINRGCCLCLRLIANYQAISSDLCCASQASELLYHSDVTMWFLSTQLLSVFRRYIQIYHLLITGFDVTKQEVFCYIEPSMQLVQESLYFRNSLHNAVFFKHIVV